MAIGGFKENDKGEIIMAAPLIGAGIALVRFGPAIMRIAKKELGNWVKKGAKEIKKPTISQKKESIVPSQLGKEVKKPKGYKDIKQKEGKTGRFKVKPESGSSPEDVRNTAKTRGWKAKSYDERPSLDPKKDIKMFDDFANYSHGGSTKKGKQRGMGKALRGGGAVTRS